VYELDCITSDKKSMFVCVCVFYALGFRISTRKTYQIIKKLSTLMNWTTILRFHTHDNKLEDLSNGYHLERK
jgi:hypothetical protein